MRSIFYFCLGLSSGIAIALSLWDVPMACRTNHLILAGADLPENRPLSIKVGDQVIWSGVPRGLSRIAFEIDTDRTHHFTVIKADGTESRIGYLFSFDNQNHILFFVGNQIVSFGETRDLASALRDHLGCVLAKMPLRLAGAVSRKPESQGESTFR